MKRLALNLSTCLQSFVLLNKLTRYMICIRTFCSHSRKFVDLTSSDRQSEHFLKKINRARFALARTDSVRSVSGSIFAKPPYRRAASVPMHLVTRTQPPMKGIISDQYMCFAIHVSRSQGQRICSNFNHLYFRWMMIQHAVPFFTMSFCRKVDKIISGVSGISYIVAIQLRQILLHNNL